MEINMNLILDTANLDEIKKWNNLLNGEITHITTNPHLLKEAGIKSNSSFKEFVLELEEIIPGVNIFFQCFSEDDVNFLVELRDKLETKSKVNYVAKVTMHPKYFNLIKLAKDLDLDTAATTCYDLIQVHQAAEFGMDYTMVYFAKNDDFTLLQDAVKMKKDYDYEINLVAASFRTKKDYMLAIKSGIDSATAPPGVLELIFVNNDTIEDIRKVYGLPGTMDLVDNE